jgi:hypothetical protein
MVQTLHAFTPGTFKEMVAETFVTQPGTGDMSYTGSLGAHSCQLVNSKSAKGTHLAASS